MKAFVSIGKLHHFLKRVTHEAAPEKIITETTKASPKGTHNLMHFLERVASAPIVVQLEPTTFLFPLASASTHVKLIKYRG